MLKRIKTGLLLLLILMGVLVIVQHTVTVYTHFLWLTIEMPVFVLLFLMAVGGPFSGLPFPVFYIVASVPNLLIRRKKFNSLFS